MSRTPPPAAPVPPRILLELNEAACAAYEQALHGTPAGTRALEYARSRGLSDATIAEARLGYAPSGPRALGRALAAAGWADEVSPTTPCCGSTR